MAEGGGEELAVPREDGETGASPGEPGRAKAGKKVSSSMAELVRLSSPDRRRRGRDGASLAGERRAEPSFPLGAPSP